MALTKKHLRYVVIYAAAAALSACVIAPNDHPNQKGYYNNSGYNNNRNNNDYVDKNISEKAQNACFKRMGHGAQIQQISDLKPGWFEVILLNPHNGHKAACTVNQQGHIGDWVNMKSAH